MKCTSNAKRIDFGDNPGGIVGERRKQKKGKSLNPNPELSSQNTAGEGNE